MFCISRYKSIYLKKGMKEYVAQQLEEVFCLSLKDKVCKISKHLKLEIDPS